MMYGIFKRGMNNMFCKFCGKGIDESAVFCSHCGKRLSEEKEIQEVKQESLTEKREPSKSAELDDRRTGLGILILCISLFLFVICIIIGVGTTKESSDNKSGATGVVSSSGCAIPYKELSSGDYEYTTSQDLTKFTIIITPNVNIKSCEVYLTLYDDNGAILYADTISKTDLKKGNRYSYTFDFGFVNSLYADNVEYSIKGRRR